MDVFVSNVWIYGLTQTCEEAVAPVDEAIENAYHVGVDAYIFDEVMRNLERSEQPQAAIDRAQTRFAEIIHGNHTIHGPVDLRMAPGRNPREAGTESLPP